MIRAAAAFSALLALAACDGGTSIQQTNTQQQTELNAIAANTSETAGAAQDGGPNANAGQAYRAGARNRPRKY